MVFKISKELKDGKRIKRIILKTVIFKDITIFKKVKKEKSTSCYLFGIQFISYKNKKFRSHQSDDEITPVEIDNFIERALEEKRQIVIWIDHSLGGGTEVYSKTQFVEMKEMALILRMQYFAWYDYFRLSVFDNGKERKCIFKTLDDLERFLLKKPINKIVVNNLVGYHSTLEILDFVARIKKSSGFQMDVSFRGHDFQCICPSFNLINCDGNFCHLYYSNGCEKCLSQLKLSKSDIDNKILRSGATTLAEWRHRWSDFFSNTADDVIVFSKSTSKILNEIYPQLVKKIQIIPHKVPFYAKVDIPPHKGINIAFLGNTSLYQKGGEIIREMCDWVTEYKNVRLVAIGNYSNPPLNLKVTGKYNPEDLPKIMREEEIDIVFISSIWPETFSYTTSEAMSMNIPVACYNLGAQAERVSVYSKGLILKDMNPAVTLARLVEFVENLRKD